jgi:hypothetical protein
MQTMNISLPDPLKNSWTGNSPKVGTAVSVSICGN